MSLMSDIKTITDHKKCIFKLGSEKEINDYLEKEVYPVRYKQENKIVSYANWVIGLLKKPLKPKGSYSFKKRDLNQDDFFI